MKSFHLHSMLGVDLTYNRDFISPLLKFSGYPQSFFFFVTRVTRFHKLTLPTYSHRQKCLEGCYVVPLFSSLLWLAIPDKFIWHLLYNSTRAFFVWVKGTK